MWKTVARVAGYGMAGSVLALGLFLGVAANSDSLNENAFAKEVGLAAVAKRANAIKKAVQWELVARSVEDRDPDKRLYGNLYSLDRDGTILFRYFSPEGRETRYARARLANIEIQELESTARRVREETYSDAVIDVYDDKYVIIWIDRKAFNRNLVRDGLAIPKADPDTPIKGWIISDYYWHKAGEEE